jgi:hypothetical protein
MWFDVVDAQFAGLQPKLQREMQRQRLITFKVFSMLICQTNLFPCDMGERTDCSSYSQQKHHAWVVVSLSSCFCITSLAQNNKTEKKNNFFVKQAWTVILIYAMHS